jgi:HEPN domain-containing protein
MTQNWIALAEYDLETARQPEINTASIPTRYPEDLQRALNDYPEPVARDYLRQTEELLQWLKHHPNLSK